MSTTGCLWFSSNRFRYLSLVPLDTFPSHPLAMQHPSQPPLSHATSIPATPQPCNIHPSHPTSNHEPASCSGRRTDTRLKMNTNQRGTRVYTPRTCLDVAPGVLRTLLRGALTWKGGRMYRHLTKNEEVVVL
ncbi:hypothetical protein Pcinc_039416 [Petrolisthes cinctipes]|uniref:Uncharacterized protein n=1 Tax=Petrolisthes cinctipes TaxID=88211 RepID=A0AAE1BNN9_PETCI|nr:hypothetical protein Pcinc_039416 [Petrolisthes cinctipes]